MKHVALIVLAALTWSVNAQLTGISVETVMVHDGSVDASLEGYTTYHVYAELSSDLDFVSAVFGDAVDPLMLGCTGTIFHSEGLNFNYATEVNPLFFAVYPAAAYDSWLTIGVEDANGGVNVQSTASTMASALEEFNSGLGFVINDPIGASWFNVFPCFGSTDLAECAGSVPSFGGADSRVLLAQITATGDVYGLFNVQVFPGGVQANQQVDTGVTFSTDPFDVFGCTNEAASNFNPAATVDDLSCVLPCTLELQIDQIQSPTCNGDNDGSIEVSTTGAQGADFYFFEFMEGTGLNFGNFLNLPAGTYTVLASDAAGCVDSLDVEVPQTEEVSLTVELTQGVSCHDESDAVLGIAEVSGGSGQYEFILSSNPTELTTQTEWTGLSGGQTLSVYAYDSNGCAGQSNVIGIVNPTPIQVALAPVNPVVDASCADIADGQIYLVGYGGVAPNTLLFSADGENYGPSPVLVAGGNYTVTAQDALGCLGTLSPEVQVGPEAIQVYAFASAENCVGSADGVVWLDATGGQGSYMYELNGSPVAETQIESLVAGTYTVTVTDGDGCVADAEVEVDAAEPILLETITTDASCFGENDGAILLLAQGGTGAFQYSANGNNFGQNNYFNNLPAGSYMLFAQDENGCVETIEDSISEPQSMVVTAILCDGCVDNEGYIDVTVEGGELPYTYEWIGPGVSGQSGQDLQWISSGSYVVEVTDANGCSVTETYTLVTTSLGCTDPGACNYAPNASVDDGNCDYGCFGCTDPSAVNFNPDATLDDGSCSYFTASCGTIGQAEWANVSSGIYPEETAEREFGVPTSVDWAIHLANVIEEPSTGQSFAVSSYEPTAMLGLPEGLEVQEGLGLLQAGTQSCVVIQGTPFQEGMFDVAIQGTLTLLLFGSPYVIEDYVFNQTLHITPNVNGIPGCTYPFATNYLDLATYDNGTCYLLGCTDEAACNFNPFATASSGTCAYDCYGCSYPSALNFDPGATVDDGTCDFEDSSGCVFDSNGDGYIGSEDLLAFLTAFGFTCF